MIRLAIIASAGTFEPAATPATWRRVLSDCSVIGSSATSWSRLMTAVEPGVSVGSSPLVAASVKISCVIGLKLCGLMTTPASSSGLNISLAAPRNARVSGVECNAPLPAAAASGTAAATAGAATGAAAGAAAGATSGIVAADAEMGAAGASAAARPPTVAGGSPAAPAIPLPVPVAALILPNNAPSSNNSLPLISCDVFLPDRMSEIVCIGPAINSGTASVNSPPAVLPIG